MMFMQTISLFFAVALLIPATSVFGQQPAADLGDKSSSLNPPAKKGAMTTQEIFKSERWQKLMHQFRDWLSVQQLYTPEQLAQIEASLRQRVKKMTPAQLQDFMYDLEQRMALLLSNEAMSARAYLSNLTPKGKEWALGTDHIPNVFGMTLPQLRQELLHFKRRRKELNQAQEEFDRVQGQRSRMVAQEQRDDREIQYRAAMDARSSLGYWQSVDPAFYGRQTGYSPYTPRPPLVSELDAARWEIYQGMRGW